jgi:hypothetical protein
MGSSLVDSFLVLGSLFLGGGNDAFNGIAEMFILMTGAFWVAGNAALSNAIGLLNFLQNGLDLLPAPLFSLGLF